MALIIASTFCIISSLSKTESFQWRLRKEPEVVGSDIYRIRWMGHDWNSMLRQESLHQWYAAVHLTSNRSPICLSSTVTGHLYETSAACIKSRSNQYGLVVGSNDSRKRTFGGLLISCRCEYLSKVESTCRWTTFGHGAWIPEESGDCYAECTDPTHPRGVLYDSILDSMKVRLVGLPYCRPGGPRNMISGVVSLEVTMIQPIKSPQRRKHIVVQEIAVGVGVELTMNWDQES
ncbi:hypothetical protein TNCV_4527021 [Trichonephila clavipes]|nr:hypothetical protein TNCV_4527021 [Trichonephila clavipes]